MNRVSPCRSRPLRRPLDRNQRQAGIWVDRNSCPGSAMMQSTRPASMIFLRISPSPDWLEDMEPLDSTNPAAPWGPDGAGSAASRRSWRCPPGNAVLPPLVVTKPLAAPVGDVEGRVGQDVVSPQVGVLIVVEAVTVGDLALDAPDGQVHLGETPGGVVGLLAVDGEVAPGPAAVAVARGVGTDELH